MKNIPWQLTRLGGLFLLVTVLLYLASLTSQSGLLLLLIGILGGCYFVNAAAPYRSLQRLTLSAPVTDRVIEEQKSATPWNIRNEGTATAYFVEVLSDHGKIAHAPQVIAGNSAHCLPDQVLLRRGVYPYATVRLASAYPFGLVKVRRRIPLRGETVVHPAVYPADGPAAAGFDVIVGGKFQGPRRSAGGSHFAGIRPLQPGDSLRNVHWKSSAKGRGLMVKTFDEELSGRVAVIIDCSATDIKLLDNCVRAAGSLMFAALDAGHHVEWIDLGRLEHRLIPPFADATELLDDLARLAGAPDALSRDRLETAAALPSAKSALAFVLTAWNAAVAGVIADLLAQRRKVSVYLPAPWTATPPDTEASLHWYTAGQIGAFGAGTIPGVPPVNAGVNP